LFSSSEITTVGSGAKLEKKDIFPTSIYLLRSDVNSTRDFDAGTDASCVSVGKRMRSLVFVISS
jgi:hypothetical protein